MVTLDRLIRVLAGRLPGVLRWAGAIARGLRPLDIGLAGKASGSAGTDALTVADLAVQELLVAALHDADPLLRRCRLDAEERILGGGAVWAHDRQPVHFGDLWRDDRADMLRLAGIVACSPSPRTLDALCDLARDWDPARYSEGDRAGTG